MYSAAEVQKMKRLNFPNEIVSVANRYFDNFFNSLKEGEPFLYSDMLMFSDVKKLAEERGIIIQCLNCSETKGEFGCRVISIRGQMNKNNPWLHVQLQLEEQ